MKKIKLCIIMVFTFLLTGCSPPENLSNNINNNKLSDDNSLSYKTRSENIKSSLNGIEGLKNVSVAIEGKTAFIGISSDTEKTELERIKKEIRRRVFITDNSIETVDITSNTKIFNMIDKLNG